MEIDPPPMLFCENVATADDWMKALNKFILAVIVLNPMACCDFDIESIGASYTIEVGWVSKCDGGLDLWWLVVAGLTVLLGFLLWFSGGWCWLASHLLLDFFLDFCCCLLLDFLEFYGFLLLLVVLACIQIYVVGVVVLKI
jgi:hypothetical protein